MTSSDKLAILVYLREIKVFPNVSNLLSIFAFYIWGCPQAKADGDQTLVFLFSFNHCCKKN